MLASQLVASGTSSKIISHFFFEDFNRDDKIWSMKHLFSPHSFKNITKIMMLCSEFVSLVIISMFFRIHLVKKIKSEPEHSNIK